MGDLDLWDIAEGLADWFDTRSGRSGDIRLLTRTLKQVEEVGEIAEALISAYGANPRKPPRLKTEEDVQKEVCDSILTGCMLLRTMTPNAREVFAKHLDYSWKRALAGGARPLGGQHEADDEDEIIFQPGQSIRDLRSAYSATRPVFAKLVYKAGTTIGQPNECSANTVAGWEQDRVRAISLKFQRALRHLHANKPHEDARTAPSGKSKVKPSKSA